ncbi:MAG: hypothetical protein JO016_02625 [Actinobacteria bacterium]|nr:hypothetical protein [Actinomycetota bacterium]
MNTTRSTGLRGGRRFTAGAAVAGLAVGLAVTAGVTGVAGCSSGAPPAAPAAPAPPVAPQLRAALQRWSAFPATAAVRPLVLVEELDLNEPAAFPSGADQHAYDDGAITMPRSWPAGPGQAAGLPLISAARAAARLTTTATPTPSPSSPSGSPGTRLIVTRVELGTAVFSTDRGQQALPAWRFSFRGATGTADVLAVATASRFWPAGLRPLPPREDATERGRSTRTLMLTTSGEPAGTGPCQATYTVRQASSAHAVALYVVETPHGGGSGVCAASAAQVTLTVTLPAPLGNRVLVDALTFAPIPVTQSLVSSS